MVGVVLGFHEFCVLGVGWVREGPCSAYGGVGSCELMKTIRRQIIQKPLTTNRRLTLSVSSSYTPSLYPAVSCAYNLASSSTSIPWAFVFVPEGNNSNFAVLFANGCTSDGPSFVFLSPSFNEGGVVSEEICASLRDSASGSTSGDVDVEPNIDESSGNV